jgi:hypothetical protein
MSTTTTNAAVAYAMSDMAPSDDGRLPAGVVSVPEPNGCGRQHRAQVDDNGHPYIKCAVCAPWLTGHAHGFATTPAGVPLTPDEMGEVEISKRQGEMSYHAAMRAMGETMGQLIQSNNRPTGDPAAAPPQPSLMEQLAALSAGDRAQLAKMLAAPSTAEGTDTDPGAQGGTGKAAESAEAPKTSSRSRTAKA